MSLIDYERPSITTDIVLFRLNTVENKDARKSSEKILQVLLLKRESWPENRKWALPGGFVNIDEELDANVKRKLKEKTGFDKVSYLEQLYTFGALDRDKRGRVISVSYLGIAPTNIDTIVDREAYEECEWIDVKEAHKMDLAFDHNQILTMALTRLRGKAEYTDILFNLLPQEFTLRDCQDVYEMVFETHLDNFKRRVNKYITPLNKYQSGKQFRPAELYAWKRA